MNQDTLQGQWTQLKGRLREQWGKLTDDDLDKIEGRSEQLIGRLQERYGMHATRRSDNSRLGTPLAVEGCKGSMGSVIRRTAVASGP